MQWQYFGQLYLWCNNDDKIFLLIGFFWGRNKDKANNIVDNSLYSLRITSFFGGEDREVGYVRF